jgi:hypothetical protein
MPEPAPGATAGAGASSMAFITLQSHTHISPTGALGAGGGRVGFAGRGLSYMYL